MLLPTLLIVLLFAAAAMLLTGCDLVPAQPTAVPGVPSDTPSPSQPTAIPTAEVEATPMPTTMTLTIWTTEAFSPTQAITSGQVLAQQVADFEGLYPDIQIEFVLKNPYGKGGILDYLLTTQAVVPGLLPDLVIIDVDELGAAVQAGVVQPLDELVPADLVADLYPVIREASTFDGRLYSLQFRADLEHLVYNTGQMTVPPGSWPGVLSNPGPYIFPAGGRAGLVNDAFLIQYLAVQPPPSEDASEGIILDQDSLAAVLQYYQDGVSRGIFPAEILDYHSADDSWLDYLAGQALLTHVNAHGFLVDHGDVQSSAPAPIPTIEGAGAAINKGWALALVAVDPVRQSAAVELMIWLMSPEANAAWTQASGYLPTRQAALAQWGQGEGYASFYDQQLQSALPRPSMTNYTQVAAALQEAVESVLTGEATAEEAAGQVIESVE